MTTHVTERKRAFFDIEDDLGVLHASAGVLHLAFAELEGRGKGGSALGQSIWFTAANIEAAVARIHAILGDEEPEADAPCACHHDEAVPWSRGSSPCLKTSTPPSSTSYRRPGSSGSPMSANTGGNRRRRAGTSWRRRDPRLACFVIYTKASAGSERASARRLSCWRAPHWRSTLPPCPKTCRRA